MADIGRNGLAASDHASTPDSELSQLVMAIKMI
jgi:hypothetical protein